LDVADHALARRIETAVNHQRIGLGLPQEPELATRVAAAPCGERKIYLGGPLQAPVYDFDALAPAQIISGPAIIESATTTVLLCPGDRSTTTSFGWFDIKLVIERTNVVFRSTDFPKMKFNQFLLTPYFGPGLLPHEQTLWIDELAVGTKRLGSVAGK
jgi:hypothetical protein